MQSEESVMRGEEVLRGLLRDQCFDVRRGDVEAFRQWLGQHLRRWKRDPAFVQQTRIRGFRQSEPRLVRLESEARRAARADAASSEHSRLEQLSREIEGATKAVRGLSRAAGQEAGARQAELQRKLSSFQRRLAALEQERARLTQESPERRTLIHARDALEQLRVSLGVDREEAQLKRLQQASGQRSGQTGRSFESQAREFIKMFILPELSCESSALGQSSIATHGEDVHVLRGVRLRASRVELDALVVRQPPSEGDPVEVLAVVESKRNINDLAHGFCRRQENLAWLTGAASGYPADVYRNRYFKRGHFDRPAIHKHQDRSFVFTRHSFRHFQRDPANDLYLDRLYLVTRYGPMWGISSGALSRVRSHIGNDQDWAPDDPQYLERLMRWCRSLTHPTESPDVLEIYTAGGEPRARQILLVSHAHSESGAPSLTLPGGG